MQWTQSNDATSLGPPEGCPRLAHRQDLPVQRDGEGAFAHLHTTLNKSRDEKLFSADAHHLIPIGKRENICQKR